jgi:hypothetical protein
MTRKHYRAIAEGFKSALYYAESKAKREGVAIAAQAVAAELKADNGNFRYDKFYAWIGLNEWGRLLDQAGGGQQPQGQAHCDEHGPVGAAFEAVSHGGKDSRAEERN